jgi:hypothetical protein
MFCILKLLSKSEINGTESVLVITVVVHRRNYCVEMCACGVANGFNSFRKCTNTFRSKISEIHATTLDRHNGPFDPMGEPTEM